MTSDETTLPPDPPRRRSSDGAITGKDIRNWASVALAACGGLLFVGRTYDRTDSRISALETKVAAVEQIVPKSSEAVDELSKRILKRLDRLDKATARIDCKLNGPGASCDAAMAAIGIDP